MLSMNQLVDMFGDIFDLSYVPVVQARDLKKERRLEKAQRRAAGAAQR